MRDDPNNRPGAHADAASSHVVHALCSFRARDEAMHEKRLSRMGQTPRDERREVELARARGALDRAARASELEMDARRECVALRAAIAEWGPFGPAGDRPDGLHTEVDLRCASARANLKAAALREEARGELERGERAARVVARLDPAAPFFSSWWESRLREEIEAHESALAATAGQPHRRRAGSDEASDEALAWRGQWRDAAIAMRARLRQLELLRDESGADWMRLMLAWDGKQEEGHANLARARQARAAAAGGIA